MPETGRRSPTVLVGVLAAWLLAPGPPQAAAQVPERPSQRVRFTTEEAFDAASIPPYRGEHPEVYAYIDAHLGEHLEKIRRWLRQPSISAQNVGIEEMAELVRSDLEALGFREAELVPTGGHPGVWGYYDAGAEKTLMVYLMYDVQPVNPEDWRVPPFEARTVETEHGEVLMARGATNQKGPERAFLNAVESIIATTGTLPVNLMVTAEGEEEIGSVHYPEIVDRYEARLRTADGVFFPFNGQDPSGEMEMSLGVKGILYLEMEAKGGDGGGPTRAEIHGSYKAIVDAPALRLVQALASLTTPDGNTILVPGYYDAVRPPTEEALGMIRRHLDERGFREIGIRQLSGYPAAQTSVEAPLVRAAIGVFRKHGVTPAVSPRLAGSAPFYQFTERLGLPLVFSGLGHGSGAHAPNEYMVIRPREGSKVAGLAEIEKAYVDLLYALAAPGR